LIAEACFYTYQKKEKEEDKEMRKEALIGLSVLLVAVSGSATVLDSFGVVSGEASVEPALSFVEVQATDNDGEYALLRNDANQALEVSRLTIEDDGGSSDDLVSTNESDSVGSGDYLLVVTDGDSVDSYSGEKDFIKASTGDSGITQGLADSGETLEIQIDGNKLIGFSYDGDCSETKVEFPTKEEDDCRDATFEVNAQ
jgi:hypothetical protein